MSKLDVFPWLTVKCYGEIFRSNKQRCSIRAPFSTEQLQTILSEFLQKDIEKCQEYQTNKSTKEIHLCRKKESMGHKE